MNCEKFMSLLALYPDAVPSGLDASDFRAHAAECPQCAGHLAEHETMLSSLQSLDDGIAVPESFGEGWRAAIQSESVRPRGSRALRWQPWAAAAAAVFMVVVCVNLLTGGGTYLSKPEEDRQRAFMAMDSAVMMDDHEGYAGGGEAESGLLTRKAAAPPDTSMPMPAPAAPADSPMGGEAQQPQIILYSASVTLETEQYDADVRRIDDLLEQMGGWSEYRSVSGEAIGQNPMGGRYASMTLRVPMDALEFFVETVTSIGKVTWSEMVAEDVSDRYYDTRGRLAMYEAQRDRLTELLSQAMTMSDIIEIESRLGELQYTIETLVGRLNNWNARADNAVVRVYVCEVARVGKLDATLGQRIGSAFSESLRASLGFLKDVVIALVEASPYILCAAVLAGITLCAMRIRKKHK